MMTRCQFRLLAVSPKRRTHTPKHSRHIVDVLVGAGLLLLISYQVMRKEG